MRKRAVWFCGLAVLVLACVLIAWRKQPKLEVGALYSVENGKGGYGIAKVLALDATAVHVRVYKQAFQQRPRQVDESTLTLGSLRDPDGFGMGHLPLSPRTFGAWKPRFIKASRVAPEELDGYNEWKKSGGGLWQ